MNQNFLQICTSIEYDLLNHNKKVSPNSVKWFQRSCLTNCFSSIFHFGKISKFRRGITPGQKIESKFPANVHIYTV